MEYCLTAKKVYQELMKKFPNKKEELDTEETVLIVFPSSTLNYWKRTVNLKSRNWLMDTYSLFASQVEFYEGNIEEIKFNVIRPPMGDGAIAAIAEQLIACGTKRIFLVCGVWGIQDFLEISDVCIPTISRAENKVSSTYYDKREIKIQKEIAENIKNIAEELKVTFYEGENKAFESFYKIPRQRILKEKENGTLTAENGELHTLLAVAKEYKIKTGAIFYNYYMPLKENHFEIPVKLYKEGGETIAKIALKLIID